MIVGIGGVLICLQIFCKVLLNRIEPVLDGILREEQAGFRKDRGCSDQIVVVRHLMQHANEMKASLSLTRPKIG